MTPLITDPRSIESDPFDNQSSLTPLIPTPYLALVSGVTRRTLLVARRRLLATFPYWEIQLPPIWMNR